MDPTLFENWDLLYDGSGDISLHVEAFDEGEDSPFLSQDVSSKRLKEKVGSGSAYHIELAGTFELVIHAVKDNEVYVSFFEKSSEYGWKRVERFVLNKQEKKKAAKIVYFGKSCGHYSIVLKD
ncbi:MAG: hypothetical protein K6E59_04855 [Bacilli bacterium]|nr:hypothetical protein [Bacilli bacterium]